MKVTNKHNALLNVAGVDVRPGATVEVDDTKFKRWSTSNAAKIWMEQKLIVTGASTATEGEDKKDPADMNGDGKVTDRERLFARARELGLNPNANTSNKKLEEMIAEAEK